jgi:RecB family exonuclease
MSTRQVLTAPRYERFREPVLRFIRTWAKCGQVLVIGAQHSAADEWTRAACEQALIGVHRLTLAHLAAALAARETSTAGCVPVSRIVTEAIAARVTDQALRANQLHYFAPVAPSPGFASALAATLTELRLDRISEAALAEAGGAAADLACLLNLYNAELRERSLVDIADQFTLAVATARAGRHAFCGLPLLLLDAAPEAAMERELVDALAEQAPALLEVNLGPASWNATSSLESLQQHLFLDEVPPRPADAAVEVFAASGEALECVEIARRISAAAGAGIPFDRMAILLRAPERYQPMVEEALRRARIPGYFTRGSRRPYASGRAFLALLECAREGLSAGRFAEYLSLGQTPHSDATDEDAPPVPAPVYWERLLVDAGVCGSEERWQRRFDGLSASLRARYESAEDESERERSARDLELLDALAEFAIPIIHRLAALPRSAPWREWLDALGGLANATLRFPEYVEELLDQLQPMADIGPVDLNDVLLALEPGLRSLRRPAEGPRYGKVFVAPIEAARGMVFDCVFVPGLNEGSFPRPPAEDPLLLDRRRQSIPGARSRARDDNRLLAIAAACTRARIVFSYSRLDLITGRQRVPSFYVFEALRAARGQSSDVRDIEREAELGAQTRIGWPAPPEPADAIDDAEFDLAVLRPAFDHPADGKGAGAYLTRVNPQLVRSLRARGRRWLKKWHAEDGLLELDIHALQVMERYRLGSRPYSPSALEQFAACPYRFALRSIHQLRPAEHYTQIQRMDPALSGDLFHRAQFELFRELRSEGMLPVTPQNLTTACERLDRALDRVSAAFAEKYAPAIPQVWAAEVESLRIDLRGSLHQAATTEPGWTPAFFEFAFGLERRFPPEDGHDPASLRESTRVLDGFLLRGSIDLVERHASGVLRVTDHKTGSLPKKTPQFVGFGEALQPVLYSLAAEAALGQPVATGRLHYATLRQNFKAIDIPINEFAKHRAGQVLRIIDDAVYRGFLPAAPREDACKHCDYVPVCGPYEEERVHRKPGEELRLLRDLRRMA